MKAGIFNIRPAGEQHQAARRSLAREVWIHASAILGACTLGVTAGAGRTGKLPPGQGMPGWVAGAGPDGDQRGVARARYDPEPRKVSYMESIVLKNITAPRRMLVAFAHPDDESFGPAGTLVHYARQGVAVHYACATRGEAGHVPEELLAGYDSLAELRTKELLCAAGHLGLTGLHLLDYRDSGMENTPDNLNPACLMQAPLEEVAEELALLIRRIQPQVVLTHDPTGGYFHPDHIKVHQATLLAFQWAGDPTRLPDQPAPGLAPYHPQKLYYTALPRKLLKFVAALASFAGRDLEAFGQNKDINLRRIAEVDQAVTTKIPIQRYWEARRLASQCHASQTGGGNGRAANLLQRLVRFDTFTRALPPYDSSDLERDLFAGIDGESLSQRRTTG